MPEGPGLAGRKKITAVTKVPKGRVSCKKLLIRSAKEVGLGAGPPSLLTALKNPPRALVTRDPEKERELNQNKLLITSGKKRGKRNLGCGLLALVLFVIGLGVGIGIGYFARGKSNCKI